MVYNKFKFLIILSSAVEGVEKTVYLVGDLHIQSGGSIFTRCETLEEQERR
jgi:hypothetical protein